MATAGIPVLSHVALSAQAEWCLPWTLLTLQTATESTPKGALLPREAVLSGVVG